MLCNFDDLKHPNVCLQETSVPQSCTELAPRPLTTVNLTHQTRKHIIKIRFIYLNSEFVPPIRIYRPLLLYNTKQVNHKKKAPRIRDIADS